MANYIELRKRALQNAKDCNGLYKVWKKQGSETINAVIEKLTKDKLIIMTVGEARTGKSSLLGAILDDKCIFPVDTDVTTCVVTMVYYGEKERIILYYKDENGIQQNREIAKKEISDYVKEQNNSNNKENVELIIVETPNEFLKDGKVIIDSPGLGSLNPKHALATYRYLKDADLVLFVSSLNSNLTETELNYINNVKKHCENILFVDTKKDLSSDYEKIINRNKEYIYRKAGINPEKQIHIPISTRNYNIYKKTKNNEKLQSSNFETLKNTINDLVTKNKSKLILSPQMYYLLNVMNEINEDLNIWETKLSNNKEKIDAANREITEINNKLNELNNNKQNWEAFIKDKITALSEEISDTFKDEIKKIAESIRIFTGNKDNSTRPDVLLDDVVSRISQLYDSLENSVNGGISKIIFDFEEEYDVLLTKSKDVTLESNIDKNVTFQKQTTADHIIDGQSNKKMQVAESVISQAGYIIGAAIGNAVAPGSGAFFGGILGKTTASLVTKATKAGYDYVQSEIYQVDFYDLKSVNQTMLNLLNNCNSNWVNSKNRLFTQIYNDLIKEISNIISEERKKNEDNKKLLLQNLDTKTYAENFNNYSQLRKVYDKLLENINSLISECVN